MAEESLLSLPFTLFSTIPINVTTADGSNYQRVTETGQMLRDTLVYGLHNYLCLGVNSESNSAIYTLRALGAPLVLGEQGKSQQQFLLETDSTEAERRASTRDLARRLIIPATPEQLKEFIFQKFLGRDKFSVTLERRVFNPDFLDVPENLEAFAAEIRRVAGYLESAYQGLSDPLINPARAYLASLGEARNLAEEDIDTPIPSSRDASEEEAERAQEKLDRALSQSLNPDWGLKRTIPGMHMIDFSLLRSPKPLKPRE